MVMYYDRGLLLPATDPFTVSKEGGVAVRKPDGAEVSVTLKRKYPVFFELEFILNRVKNGRFQVADSPDFRDARTSGAFVNMAEVGFYAPSGEKLVGEIIGTEGSYGNSGDDKYKLFDGDPLTYFNAPQESRCWGGMAFDRPQTLGSVMFLPRNDDNFIQADELYELFYCRDGRFVSLGRRIGDRTHVLHYDNVPGNALLLLRNHTKGKEERIFTYENDEQIWW